MSFSWLARGDRNDTESGRAIGLLLRDRIGCLAPRAVGVGVVETRKAKRVVSHGAPTRDGTAKPAAIHGTQGVAVRRCGHFDNPLVIAWHDGRMPDSPTKFNRRLKRPPYARSLEIFRLRGCAPFASCRGAECERKPVRVLVRLLAGRADADNQATGAAAIGREERITGRQCC